MSYNIIYNRFAYLRGFERDLLDHKNNPDIALLANQLAMLGSGKEFNEDGSMEWPLDNLSQEFNEMLHHLLKEYKVLNTLRGFFEFDCTLDEENEAKILAKGADEDMVKFLVDNPDPRYFTPSN